MSIKNLVILAVAGICFSCKTEYSRNDLINQRIDSLLDIMTIDEKIGQMTQICFSTITLDGKKTLDLQVEVFKEAIQKYHVGSFLSGSDSKEKWYAFIRDIQQIAIEETRLHIPLIIGIDHVHGANYVNEGTILPHNLNMSCTFNTALMSMAANVTAEETADLGLSWNFAPVLDVGKNPFWPRLYETFGEDPLVCASMGKAFIVGYQENNDIAPYKLAACAKHFIGYSDPESGWDRTPSLIPDQQLHEIFVPPFKTAIDAGVKSVMVNSGELNGEPVHASSKLLSRLLRQRLGFDGVIITDIKDIQKIVDMHGGASDYKEATLMAINAGIDMNMACNSFEFCDIIKQLLNEQQITVKRIDESVRRILRLKFELGLFEHPYPRSDRFDRFSSPKHLETAYQSALESIVLLKNDSILPLKKNQKLLVTGFAANSRKMLNGAWTFEWMGAEEARQPQNMKTLFQALSAEFDSVNVKHLEMEGISSGADQQLLEKHAAWADVIIVTAGEKPYSEFKGNINDLMLEPGQQRLIQTAASTGKPVVVILIEGRPRIITNLADTAKAILFAGYPGQKGGEAIAAILSGKENPSGRLSFTYPATQGHIVAYYHKKSDKYQPLYPFGYGLSYSNVIYSNLIITDTIIAAGDKSITASIEIQNKSDRECREVVMWFISDQTGHITRPVRQLKKFEKIFVPPGIKKKVTFEIIPGRDLSYPDENGNTVIESGCFMLTINDKSIRFQLKQ